ncbi:hypothetical protein VOLCADRAFT_94386 [Volvox carteri f. nagariensis]|uniref:Uncharacterized protein n=1 Tax=Volvox carteri f. nagariensis TaxID=3068 RepID=D8U4M9_VOLCA|nr:uncharacterized protein VOLCADRAFT_94386 [Volvox carteri f. nagariensis]EFJ45217.1 hypothetical protein VOLCADRAFT_94386 [Volvox carteri f. nagariensis]|eukprot:XP_002953593.1 hypothetical protein VOLCADRAFT_94386 [Volvox carteri f. nagariensis]
MEAATTANGQHVSETGDNGDFTRTLLPPIGVRGSRRFEAPQPPPEVDKFSRAMDKVMAERALTVEAPGEENAAGHIIARRETQMASKHGIAKVGKGVVEKFHAARHNTAIMSAMGHPGLEKLVAKEEEEKRKRRARIKVSLIKSRQYVCMYACTHVLHVCVCARFCVSFVCLHVRLLMVVAVLVVAVAIFQELTAQRNSANGRNSHYRGGHEGEHQHQHQLHPQAQVQPQSSVPLSQHGSELPNVYVALGQSAPSSRNPSTTLLGSLPPAQPQSQSHAQQAAAQAAAVQAQAAAQQTQVSAQQPQAAARSGGASARSNPAGGGGGGGKETGSSPRAAPPRTGVPSGLRPLAVSTGGASSEWEGQSHSNKGSSTSRRGGPGGRWRRRAQANTAKSGHSSESVIRATSRVGRVLAEFGGHDDWCSVTVLRHSLATILQANIRGWLVRRKWLANPNALVNATKAVLEAERAQKERRAALKLELERRALTRKQKEKAANVLQMLFPQVRVGVWVGGLGGVGVRSGWGAEKSMVGVPPSAVRRGSSGDNVPHGGNSSSARAKWTRLNKNLDLATEQEAFDLADSLDGSDSETSDLGLEEMALVKMRARTPPWQKAEQSQWEGQWAKLNTKTGRGNLDVVWDLSDTAARVQAVQQRRAERTASSADGKTSRAGDGAAAADSQQYDPATQPLPAAVVNELLVHRYIDNWVKVASKRAMRNIKYATCDEGYLRPLGC